MKKVLSVLMVVAAMMFATNANAQIKFGLKGGLDVTNMSLSNDVFDASNKTGFFVGPMVKVTIPIVGLSFDAAALYDQKEAKVSVKDAETTMTQKSLNIPVNVRYGFGLSSLANVFVFAGPQWGIVGLGVTLLSHLQLSANYNIACGKTADVTWEETGKNIVNGNSKNNSWQIALGYWF